MIRAFVRAIGQLFDARILGLIGLSALLSLVCFVGAWFLFDWVVGSVLAGHDIEKTIVSSLGGIAAVVAAWFWFPLLASAFVGLFLDRVARAVEARHYPHLPAARGLPFVQALGASARFFGLLILANALLLLLAITVPVAYPLAYVGVNGFLLGREYFDLVAFRRIGPAEARAVREAHAGELLVTGITIAFLLAVPFANVVMPIVATAVLVHRFEEWRAAPRQAAGG